MGLSLRNLLQGAEAQINPFDHGKTFNSVQQTARNAGKGAATGGALYSQVAPNQSRAQVPQLLSPPNNQDLPQVPLGQDAKNYGYVPDITYNPNQNTDIPYSSHDPSMVALGNIYAHNPMDPRVTHMDPALFGYPADDSSTDQYANSSPHVTIDPTGKTPNSVRTPQLLNLNNRIYNDVSPVLKNPQNPIRRLLGLL